MYIYTVKYISRNMSNTHEPGDEGERSREHRSTQLRYTIELRSIQQEQRPTTLTCFLHPITWKPKIFSAEGLRY